MIKFILCFLFEHGGGVYFLVNSRVYDTLQFLKWDKRIGRGVYFDTIRL